MNITPSQGTLQAFGNAAGNAAPATQVRQPVTTQTAERPAANTTQRVDAAPRAEAPARPDADSRSQVQASPQQDRPGSRVNLLV